MQGVGFAVLIVIGLVWQKKHCPSYLKKQQGEDIPKLFRFQLSNRVSVDELAKHELDYVGDEPKSTALRFGPTWFLSSSSFRVDSYMLKRIF